MTFDWVTFALQLVNILILLAILRHFLFRPVAAIIERRRAEARTALDSAVAAKREAEAAAARARADADASAAARHDLMQQAARQAEAQRAALVEKARAEAARIVDDGRASRAREDADAEERTVARVRDLAAAVAKRALSEHPKDPAGYAVRLAAALEGMEAPERDALLRGGDLTLVTARDLPDPVLEAAWDALRKYGASATVTTDTALIDGIELRSRNGVLRNSIAHDLDLLSKAMRDVRSAS